ncbi:MAG TPA: sodium:solute symporter family protein [bacterium]|nr:sodium:solute symporter family protein [bacterium]
MTGGFGWLDTVVLVGYFLGITAFGLWMARRTRTSDGFFRGERKLSWWIMVGQAFGTGTHAEMPVAQAGATFQYGFAAIWYQWKNMLITPFYWFIAPWYRRSERTTVGEIVEDRYGRKLGMFYSVFAILFFVFSQGAMLQGAAKIISVASGDLISSNMVVVGMTVAFLTYSFFGGLIASAYTDFVQSFLIIVLSLLLLPAGLSAVGGFHGMRQVLTPDFFNLYSKVSGLDAFTISMLAVNGIVGITAQPHMISMCATGSTERAGRVGQTYGSIVKRLCTIAWALVGLIVAALLIQRGATIPDPEHAFGYACRELLLPGLTGLMVAAVLAANMSTCSNFMVNTGALFTQNFYRKYLNPDAADARLLFMGRLSGFVLTLLGVIFALTIKNVLHAFLFTETIAAFMGIMIFGGILWKRANRYGALVSVCVSFGLYYGLNYHWTGKWMLVYSWQPAPFGAAMLAGFVCLLVVSLLTKEEEPQRIAAFFDNMQRLSDHGTPKPLAKEHGQDLIFVDLPGWFTRERWQGFGKRYREDWAGFLFAWLVVGCTVALAWGIMQLGK